MSSAVDMKKIISCSFETEICPGDTVAFKEMVSDSMRLVRVGGIASDVAQHLRCRALRVGIYYVDDWQRLEGEDHEIPVAKLLDHVFQAPAHGQYGGICLGIDLLNTGLVPLVVRPTFEVELLEYGLWGGTAPGGWCLFLMTQNPDYLGYGYASDKREEVEAARDVFRANNPSLDYEVVAFDSDREPVGDDDVPTSAQLRWLETLGRVGSDCRSLWALPGSKATYEALCDRGWVMSRVRSSARTMITKAGLRAVERGVGAAAVEACDP